MINNNILKDDKLLKFGEEMNEWLEWEVGSGD